MPTEPTERQLRILVTWIECQNTTEAGRILGLHPHTVRHILSDIQAILGAAHSGQAFAIAVQRGLVDPARLRLPDAA